MSNNLETHPEAGTVHLVHGIIADVHALVRQQLALFRHELDGELVHARKAALLIAVGLTIAIVGSGVLAGMLVYLLAQMAPEVPLWACYGLVGAPIVTIGLSVCLVGVQRFNSVHRTTVELAQELREKRNG